jgi:thymidylate synthase (FAD)
MGTCGSRVYRCYSCCRNSARSLPAGPLGTCQTGTRSTNPNSSSEAAGCRYQYLRKDRQSRFLDAKLPQKITLGRKITIMHPRIYTIARPILDAVEIQRFLDDERETWDSTDGAQPAENVVEIAGRLCYMSFGARQFRHDNYEYVRNLISQGHESVLEHVAWSFIIASVSRSFTHQLVRHRIGFSYSQLSQQYHDEEDADTAIPAIIGDNPDLLREWQEIAHASKIAYHGIVSSLEASGTFLPELSKKERNRLIRSAARGILPANTLTKIMVTANARALRHFFSIRGNLEGDEEMRLVSTLLFQIVSKDAPSLFADFEIEHLSDGSPVLRQRLSR